MTDLYYAGSEMEKLAVNRIQELEAKAEKLERLVSMLRGKLALARLIWKVVKDQRDDARRQRDQAQDIMQAAIDRRFDLG